jgi:hypothetical protein
MGDEVEEYRWMLVDCMFECQAGDNSITADVWFNVMTDGGQTVPQISTLLH